MNSEDSCRFCHCSETRACPGGCSWHRPGYCSACADGHLEQLVEAAMQWPESPGDTPHVAAASGRLFSIVDGEGSLSVFDHVGAIAFAWSPQGVYLAPQYDALELLPLFREQEARAA